MSRTFIKMLPFLALAGLLAGCGPGSNSAASGNGTAAPAAGSVLVTVNGEPITTSELDAYVALRTHGAKIHLNDTQRHQIAQQLIQLTLASQEAEQENLLADPTVQAGLALQKKLYLANQAVEHYMTTAAVPQSTLQAQYAKQVAAESGEQYKARHILVKSEAQAKKIIKQLNKGADFATLAKKDSTDPGSAKQGGELGWFKPQQMVPEFSAAVAKLKPGQYTKTPVKSQFGWHVILLEDERSSAPPSFTASKPMLERQARDDMLREHLQQMQSDANIDWKVPNPASAAAAKMEAARKAIQAAAAAKAKAAGSAAASAQSKAPAAATH